MGFAIRSEGTGNHPSPSVRGRGLGQQNAAKVSHVVRLLLLGLLLLLLSSGSGSTSGSPGGDGASSRDGRELLGSGGDHLGDVLSGELLHELSELVAIGLSSDGSQDLLDVSAGWGGVSSEDALV